MVKPDVSNINIIMLLQTKVNGRITLPLQQLPVLAIQTFMEN